MQRFAISFLLMLCVAQAHPAAAQTSDAAHQQFVFAYRLLQRNEPDLAAKAFDEFLGKFPRDEKRGDALYYRAMLARQAADTDKAAELLKDVPEPKYVPIHAVQLLRGQVHTDRGKYKEALADLEQIKLDKLDATLQATVLLMRGVAARELGNLEAAAAQLDEAAKIRSPLQGRAMLDLARVYARSDSKDAADKAIAVLKQAMSLDDAAVAAEAARLAGDLAYNSGKFGDAQRFYDTVVARYPGSSQFGPAVLGQLWAHFAAHQFEEVLTGVDKWKDKLSVDQRFTAWYLKGSAFQELGRHEEAIGWYDAALRTNRKVSIEDNLLYKKAVSAAELKRYDAMDDALEQLRRRHPQSPRLGDAVFLEAVTQARRGNVAEAAARLTAIIERGPKHPYYTRAILERAKLYELNEKPDAAIADYEAYLALESAKGDKAPVTPPEEASLQHAGLRLIYLCYSQQRYDAADKHAQQLLERDGLQAFVEQEALYRKALNDIKLKRLDTALKDIERLLKNHPQNLYQAEARYYRGLLRMAADRADEAIDDLLEASKIEHLAKPLRINALRLVANHQLKQDNTADAAAALASLEKLAGLDDMSVDERLWLARHSLDAGEPRNTIKYVTGLLRDSPDVSRPRQTEAWMLTAQALASLGDHEPAIKAYRRVIAMGFGFELRARLGVAGTLAAAGQTDDAINEYKGLVSGTPSAIAAAALFELGRLHRAAGEKALRDSNVRFATEQFDQARMYLKRLVVTLSFEELAPLPQLALIQLAELARLRNDETDLNRSYTALVENHADTPSAA